MQNTNKILISIIFFFQPDENTLMQFGLAAQNTINDVVTQKNSSSHNTTPYRERGNCMQTKAWNRAWIYTCLLLWNRLIRIICWEKSANSEREWRANVYKRMSIIAGRSVGVGPMRRPGDRKIDTSPYSSGNIAYLSPPSDSNWRRTSSDSAIHQSLMQNQVSHSPFDTFIPVNYSQFLLWKLLMLQSKKCIL